MHRVSREVRELVDDVAIPRPGEYDLDDVVINVALSVGGDASGDELGGVCGGVEGIDVLQDHAGQLVELIQASSGAGDIEIGLSQGGLKQGLPAAERVVGGDGGPVGGETPGGDELSVLPLQVGLVPDFGAPIVGAAGKRIA